MLRLEMQQKKLNQFGFLEKKNVSLLVHKIKKMSVHVGVVRLETRSKESVHGKK